MIEDAIGRIAVITRGMHKVPYPSHRGLQVSGEDLAALFASRLEQLRAPGDCEPAVVFAENAEHAGQTLADMCREVPDHELLWQTKETASRADPREALIGITSAHALIAASGSVVLELPDAGSAWPSLLVDRHIVVASRDKLVSDLGEFYAALDVRFREGGVLPNFVCITGCSRTADIEKLLVVPAHGPRQVRVILAAGPIDWAQLRREFRNLRIEGFSPNLLSPLVQQPPTRE